MWISKRSGWIIVVVSAATACSKTTPSSEPETEEAELPPIALLEGRDLPGRLAVAHAGVGTDPSEADGPQTAAAEALVRMEAGESPLDGALAGTVSLEDDPRFNAGTGANIRLDGQTIQMDASLMTDDGRFAAVAIIERVKNPVLVAREVLDSPHVLLAGEGATRFAHARGFEDVVPRSEAAEASHRRRIAGAAEQLERGEPPDWPSLWNYPTPLPPELAKASPKDAATDEGSDTVGTVTRNGEGRFAATLSTGGTSLTLYGRVGDVPVYGAGLYAGPAGAIACTGKGEEIIRQSLARSVYQALERGVGVKRALHEAVARFPKGAAVGLIAVDREGWAVAANGDMAYGVAPR